MMLGDLMPLESDPLTSRGSNSFFPMARLKPGTPLEAVETALEGVTLHLRQSWPEVWQAGDRLLAMPATDVILHPTYDRMVVTANVLSMVMVGLILLVACVNLSGTLLARALDRRREIAVRLALGAGRGRLIGQLLTETLLLAAAGGAAGLFLASRALHLFNTIPIPGMLSLDLQLDQTVLIFTSAVSLLTGVLVGLGPALRATRLQIAPVLKDGSAGGSGVKCAAPTR
jgi:ABC-type antimicrobial peptide transport system permease subunit